MSKLIRANMARLWKDKIFWICFLLLTVLGAAERIGMGMDDTQTHYLEECFWIGAVVMGIVMAVFVSLFVGAEHHDGTIRNKIVLGHTRSDIYLANVIVCIVAEWLMCLGCLTASLLAGVPLLGWFHMELLSTVLLEGICVFALSAAYAAIYCFIAMLNSNRTTMAIANRLEQQEYYYTPDFTLGIGEVDDGEKEWIRNPAYLEGTERRMYEIFFEILPGGQSLQLSGMLEESHRYAEMFLASLAWSILSCGCGVTLFRKKDLK